MKQLDRSITETNTYPERIMQIGEGNFLRAFFDWMVYKMNKSNNYNSGVTVVQPLGRGLIGPLNQQDGLFTVRLTAMKDGQPSVTHDLVDCVNKGINPYADFSEFMAISNNPDLKLVVSNTTEAGIAYEPADRYEDQPPSSYPGKLTVFLHKRFEHFSGDADKGLVVLPVELIENNADTLKEIILRYADLWKLGADFNNWIESHCVFCNTLVDRIVTGYPREIIDEIQEELGYEDKLVVEGEQFHLWAIDANDKARQAFPADRAGLNVVFTDDLQYYRTRKVRVLNGAHTSMTVIGMVAGIETVREAIEHPVFGPFIERLVYEQIVPTLGESEELKSYAGDILNRFRNPYIKHFLASISLNSVSKYKARILPTLLDFNLKFDSLPNGLVLALASLIRLYKGELRGGKVELKDDPEAIALIQDAWKTSANDFTSLVGSILGNEELWGQDLTEVNGLAELTTNYLQELNADDPAESLLKLLQS